MGRMLPVFVDGDPPDPWVNVDAHVREQPEEDDDDDDDEEDDDKEDQDDDGDSDGYSE